MQLIRDGNIAVQGVLQFRACRQCFDVYGSDGGSCLISECVLYGVAERIVTNTHHVGHPVGGQ